MKLTISLDLSILSPIDDKEQAKETVRRIIGGLFPSGEFGGLADISSLAVAVEEDEDEYPAGYSVDCSACCGVGRIHGPCGVTRP